MSSIVSEFAWYARTKLGKSDLVITFHQFLPDLAAISHYPDEVTQPAEFISEKSKDFLEKSILENGCVKYYDEKKRHYDWYFGDLRRSGMEIKMYELVQVSEKCYYINCPAKIGIYVADREHVYLVDSGNDKDARRKIRQILDKNGWHMTAILNTHSNADHIGGNKYLQGQTGCRIYSGGIEAAFIKYPVLEPSFLYGGYPCKNLLHKFPMAQESDMTDFTDESFPKEIEVIPLPGHFFDMVGFRMPDGVVFLADCISSREMLEKYAVSFIYDVEAYLETLDMVEKMETAMFIPAHAEASADVRELVRYNRDKVQSIAERILSICEAPVCFERILQEVFRGYGLAMNFEQYVLAGSTVRSYLSWLKDNGKLTAEFQDSMSLWQKR